MVPDKRGFSPSYTYRNFLFFSYTRGVKSRIIRHYPAPFLVLVRKIGIKNRATSVVDLSMLKICISVNAKKVH